MTGRVNTRANAVKNSKNIQTMFKNASQSNNQETMPSKPRDSDSLLQEILSKIETLVGEVSDIKSFMANVNKLVKETVCSEISKRETKWEEDRLLLEDKVHAIERIEESRLRKERKNNVVLRGFIPKSNDTKDINEEIKSLFEDKLGVSNVDIADITSIKPRKGDMFLIVKFANQESKRSIMINKHKIANSELYIYHDRTPKERDIHRQIAKIAEEEKKKGSIVQMGHMKVIINGSTKVWKEGVGLVESKTQAGDASQNSFRN